MQEVDSAALERVAKILRLSTGGSQLTEFQDELLQQVIDIMPMARRALTPGRLGIFTATILNTHVGSDTITVDVDPYEPGTTFVGNGYPAVVDENFDVWLLAAHALNVTAPGDFGGGFLSLLTTALGMGWRNEANAIAVNSLIEVYNQETTFGNVVMLTGGGSDDFTHLDIGRRIPRDTVIRFQTVKSGVGAGTYKAFLWLGIFPAGLGQDVV